MKRFYKDVARQQVGDDWQVTLDGRGIKTQGGRPQSVPNEEMAIALASEWIGQGEEIDPATFILRDMVDYAIDVVAPHPAGVAHKLVAYADTDTLLYRADPDEPLYARQQEVWEPIVAAFEAREGVTMKRVSGIMHTAQNEASLETLRQRLITLDPFSLAGLESMTSIAASLITGLTALEPGQNADALYDAAHLEEEWQAEQWGRDEEAEDRKRKRQNDFTLAHNLTRLARGEG